jgi:glycosyltransferase involved in cell wall biosynthesis
VHWLPWQDDAAPLCAALDLCVHPAEREPFGRVLIEAMACGVPVIAADSGGPQEILRPGITGRLCPPTPAAFAAAIGELLTTPLHCADLGLAARADIQARFSLPVHREALLALYAACRG